MQDFLTRKNIETIPHPPYSPTVKKDLKGRRYSGCKDFRGGFEAAIFTEFRACLRGVAAAHEKMYLVEWQMSRM